MSENSFQVLPYSIEKLVELASELSPCSNGVIEDKLHIEYFRNYFEKLSAKTIVVEHPYVDRAYLEDFAAYYVRCFRNYDSFCARLHFFQGQFETEGFEATLRREQDATSVAELQETYLGFVVIKPLPKTLVGRTCLKTYPLEDNRYFPSVRCHSVNLFGMCLEVETVAFQEQDKVVAACATSALWSIFQCTAKLFDHSIPSPVSITRSASAGLGRNALVQPKAGPDLPTDCRSD